MRIFIYIMILFFSFSCKNKEELNESTQETVVLPQSNSPKDVEEITATKARELISTQPEIVILDVRTPEETNAGTLENAIIMDLYSPDFQTNLNDLDKTKTYIVYCAVGGRSKSAGQIMKEKGFQKVYNLQGGYNAWNQ